MALPQSEHRGYAIIVLMPYLFQPRFCGPCNRSAMGGRLISWYHGCIPRLAGFIRAVTSAPVGVTRPWCQHLTSST